MNHDSHRLLIVEDDESYRSLLSRSLQRRGFEVRCAADADSALATCAAFRPAYVLLDLNLQGDSGLNLIRPLLAYVADARIVILTGYASIQTTVAAMRLGACHYLPKPANTGDIIRALLDDGVAVDTRVDEEQLSVQHLQWEYIQRKLAENDGSISATARALKMHRRTLQRKLAKRRPPDLGFAVE